MLRVRVRFGVMVKLIELGLSDRVRDEFYDLDHDHGSWLVEQ